MRTIELPSYFYCNLDAEQAYTPDRLQRAAVNKLAAIWMATRARNTDEGAA